MDTSFWIQCNPKIAVEHTSKKYYGKYLYKIVMYCPAGRLIDNKGPMDRELEHRKAVSKHINQSGWWGYRRNRDLDQADITLLEVMRTIRRDSGGLGIKLRVEEPRIQIYAETESELKDLIQGPLKSFGNVIETVAGPANAEAVAVLNSGAIIRKTDNGYSHKIILRDGRYTATVKDSLLQYLSGLGYDTVLVPKSCYLMLGKPSGYIWNCYIYSNDPSIVTFINLIHPGLVSNIHELVVAH